MTDLFEQKAKDWDADSFKQKLSSAIGGSILDLVPLHDQMVVMDFGAGTGLISSQVAPLVNKIVAVDISESMLSRLAAKPELQGKVDIVCQDILETPLTGDNEKVDLIISAMAMHHVEDTTKLLQGFAEHLNPGASVALADLDKEDGSFHPKDTEGVYHFGFERAEFQTLLERNGFENVKFYTAHTIDKNEVKYPIFLVTATKS